MRIEFSKKRVDGIITTFLLFTLEMRFYLFIYLIYLFSFFCNFYITPYFGNISFDIVLKL